MHKQGRRASSCFLSVLIGLFVFLLAQGGPSFSAYVERPNPRPSSAIALFGDHSREFEWYDTNNPPDTEYRVGVSELGGGSGVWGFYKISQTKSTPAGETDGPFTANCQNFLIGISREWPWQSPDLPGDPRVVPEGEPDPDGEDFYTGMLPNFTYAWQVQTRAPGGDWEEGRQWVVHTPIAKPGMNFDPSPHGALSVGVYPRFVWSEHPHLPDFPQAKVLLVDLDEGDPNYSKGWVDNDGNINEDRVVKTYAPNDGDAPAIDKIREFWHFDENWQRLLPNRNYAWRIVYCDDEGNALFDDREQPGEDPEDPPEDPNDQKDAGEPYLWADGGGDTADGWQFRTVGEITSAELNSPNTRSLIIYWQSMYGTLDPDPWEGDFTFASVAEDIEYIHEQIHDPAISTAIVGTQEVTASYGGLHNDDARRANCTDQAPWPDEITGFEGWYTMGRSARNNAGMDPGPTHVRGTQDRYREWTARGIRTLLQDTTNKTGFGGISDRAYAEHLEQVTLLGDADHVAPSFYHHYQIGSAHKWVGTDFFYSTQNDTSAVELHPAFQVSRIPLQQKSEDNYRTYEASFADPRTTVGRAYADPEPVVEKIWDFSAILSESHTGNPAAKSDAYQDWFGRAVVVAGGTNLWEWFQFFPAFVQNLLSGQVAAVGGPRDTFAGLKVRQYNMWGAGEEALSPANVLRHLTKPEADAVPGFVYLLAHGQDWQDLGDQTVLDPFGQVIEDNDFDRTWDAPHGRRPLLISAAGQNNRFDTHLWGSNEPWTSLGEAACLARGGPIGIIGFASADYWESAEHSKTYPDGGTTSRSFRSSGVDDIEGHVWPDIDQGQVSLAAASDPASPLRGKIELIKLIAERYQSSTNPGIGDVLNNALAEYVEAHATELENADDQSVVTTVFGACLLGDSALSLPPRQRPDLDKARPVITDENLRSVASPSGYDATPGYNSAGMPVHVIARWDPDTETNPGTPVELTIETDADNVRVRVMTPFDFGLDGQWYDPTTDHWSDTEPDQYLDSSSGSCNYTFTAFKPSIYLIVVQAENPAWDGTDPDDPYRWLKERWFYVQVVNEFERNPDANILVVDMDQPDRYYLNGHGTFYSHVEDYYVNLQDINDLDGFNSGDNGEVDPRTLTEQPALPILNYLTGQNGPGAPWPWDYGYQYWCTQVYHTLQPNAQAILDGQRYYGDLTPSAIESFRDTYGPLVVFTGDSIVSRGGALISFPHRYLFLYNSMPFPDVNFLQNFLEMGGKLFVTNQTLSNETDNVPYLATFQEDFLGAVTATEDSDYSNMEGLFDDTMSKLIQDLEIEGGNGESNTIVSAELDPNGTGAATVFIWDEQAGGGELNSSKSAAIHNRLIANAARTLYFPWPFESIDHALQGNTLDFSGRVNVMKQALEWLQSVAAAGNPIPANGAVDVPLNITFEWSEVTESDGYEVYFAESGQALTLVADITNTADNDLGPGDAGYPGPLTADTQYVWRVATKNPGGGTTTPDTLWQFRTVSLTASNPNPPDGATGVSPAVTLSWSGAVDLTDPAEVYEVYLWEDGDQIQLVDTIADATEYTPPAPLAEGILYNWRVDSVIDGMNYEGDPWEFETATADQAFNPDPVDGATGVPVDKTLSWSGPPTAQTYDVFLGQGSLPGTPTVSGLNTPQFDPPTDLTEGATYVWRVDVNHTPASGLGTVQGLEWTFTVETAGAASNPVPADGANGVSLITLLSWLGQADSYDIYFGAGSLPGTPNQTGLTVNFWYPGQLTANTTYVWRVDSHIGASTVIGAVWTFTTGTQQQPDDGGGGGGGGGGCFIATSAMEGVAPAAPGLVERNCTGEYVLPEDRARGLELIRGLRDDLLMRAKPGRQFSAWYYAFGPYAAEAIRHREPAKAVVRGVLLRPLAGLSEDCLTREQE